MLIPDAEPETEPQYVEVQPDVVGNMIASTLYALIFY